MSHFNHYANLGAALLAGQQRAETGWTAPSLSWDKMREINSAALSLDQDVSRYVQNKVFLQGWKDWLADWKNFYEHYQGIYAKLGAAFYSDELAARVEEKRRRLEGWRELYTQQVAGDGRPVPAPTAPGTTSLGVPPDPGARLGVPWWVVSLITLGVVGAGVLGYFYVKKKGVLATKVVKAVATDVPYPQGDVTLYSGDLSGYGSP